MNEPDDPGGTPLPQGLTFAAPDDVPLASQCITITQENTDCENPTNLPTKRKRQSRVCKHCNKKRRSRHGNKSSLSGIVNDSDCRCGNPSYNTVQHFINEVTEKPIQNQQLLSSKSTSSAPVAAHSSSDTNNTNTIGRHLYQATDVSPFVVHIVKEQTAPNQNLTLHPVTVGYFLKKKFIKGVVEGSLKKVGRNRVTVSFSNFEDANSFLNNDTIKLNNYKTFIPTSNITRMGVIRGVPVDWSDDDILNNITVPVGCGKILKVRRLKKKSIVNGKPEFNPIETVVVTFDGQILPKRIFLCYNSLPVDLYIYPTIQCFQCCRYGHVKSQCRSLPRCYKCGLDHTGDTCDVEEEDIVCFLCSGPHMATNRKCPEFLRQKAIKESMAKSCITYAEALKLHPPISKSFADVVITGSSGQQRTSNPLTSNSKLKYVHDKNPGWNSYKKTVLTKPRSPFKPGKSYNRDEHEALTKDYNTPFAPSKSVLINNDNCSSLSNMSVKDLLITLISSLTHSNIISPSDVAIQNNDFVVNHNTTVDGQASPSLTVEL
ncbi:hypothetical protein ABMA27_015359 [Loxostege sticticalis]|uniref:CCHC-type domain-containing protein n=1 Tax=Loxostege sticticalis TaxID=481309 RepID=A0ABR3I7B8_LOXSC